MKTKLILPFILFISLLSNSTLADYWRVNWQHSKVSFEIPYMGVSSVTGAFTKFDGGFEFSPETMKLEQVEFIINSKSVDTNNSKRDKHIRNKDFFNVNKYPQIKFKSKKTIYKQNSPIAIIGDLTFLGKTKDVKFDLEYKGSAIDPWDKSKVAQFFNAETKINRKEYGLNWNKTLDEGGLLLGEEVSIKIIIEAFKDGVRPAFSRFYLPTKEIKKSVQNEVKSQTSIEQTEENNTSTPISTKAPEVISTPELPSNKEMFLNMLFGFISFIVLIGGGIKLQLVLTKFLEKKGLDPKWTFIIPNIIVMILIMYFATLLAPFMGYGPHPWK